MPQYINDPELLAQLDAPMKPAPATRTPQEFAKVYGAAAERAGKALGVDPQMLLGQWGLETGWGKSVIPGTNNLGNIKDLSGAGTAATDNMTGSRDKYRAYESPDAFADDFVSLVQRRYPGAVGAKDPLAFATALKDGGYAEDPRYVDKVVQATRMAGTQPNPVMKAVGSAVEAVVPSAQAAPAAQAPQRQYIEDPELLAQLESSAPAPKKRKSIGELAYRGATMLTPFGGVMNMLSSGDAGKDLGNAAAGAVRGAGSIGATIVAPVDIASDAIDGKGLTLESNRQRRKDMDAALTKLGADTSSGMFQLGKLGTEIAGTGGVGQVLAAPVRAAGATRLATAIGSGGMTAGGAPAKVLSAEGARQLATRAAGGAITGAASAGAVNPDDTGAGAAIGAVAPPVISGLARTARAAGGAVRELMTPAETRAAAKLAETTGIPRNQLLAALEQQGPSMIPGYRPTVPQILQTPELSQLQRTLQTSGNQVLADAGRAQQGGYREALNRVAGPDGVALDVQDAAQRAGGALQDFALPARAEATANVRRAFDAVDPMDEARLLLPLEEMGAAQSKFLGRGTFGTGGKAAEAMRTAEQIGTEELPAVTAKATPSARRQGEDIVSAIKALGGIKQDSAGAQALAGEIYDLKQSAGGMRSIIQNGRGQSPDTLAQAMHARGFIPDDDPVTLMNALREHAAGSRVFSSASERGGAMQAGVEAAMGEAPVAERIAKAVPFRELQNLRSSIGEAAEQAAAKGANKEAAALRVMVGEIDARVNRAASGRGEAGEFFPRDIADQYRNALDLHAQKMQQFETGPQAGMFRKGGDGQASVQGAEIPGKFYSGRRSQVDDVQSLKRLVGDRDDLMAEMKRYAVTEGASTKAQTSEELTTKFRAWLRSRSGANRELFNAQELATLEEVGKAVKRQLDAENLGRVTGSDTAQKLASLQSNGLLDSRAVDVLANRIPVLRSVTGPVLTGLREASTRGRNNQLAALLADPEVMAAALRRQPQGPTTNALMQALPLTYRAAPVLIAQ